LHGWQVQQSGGLLVAEEGILLVAGY
jgi:hypothetical protein